MKDTDTELYFTTWGAQEIYNYEDELDRFKDYHQMFYDELKGRDLDI